MILDKPEEPGRKYALTFTILVHVGLVAALFQGGSTQAFIAKSGAVAPRLTFRTKGRVAVETAGARIGLAEALLIGYAAIPLPRDALAFIAMIIVFMIRPQGLLGKKTR